MPYQFFLIPVRGADEAAAAMNQFLNTHRVLSVDRRWVDQGADSYWSFCVDYLDAAPKANAGRASKQKGKDYKEILSDEEFSVFSRLRDLRKEIAQAEAVPVYTVFNNEQLAEMVQSKARTKADLERIGGVGDARIEKYGQRFLELLHRGGDAHDEASGEPV